MDKVNEIVDELGVSKVKLAKYLGVSRQMIYNYLKAKSISDWPKEKEKRFLALFDVNSEEELKKIEFDNQKISDITQKINNFIKDDQGKEVLADLKGFNKKEQDLLIDIIHLLKHRLSEDKSKETYFAYTYLYHYLQSMETNKELKYILAYMSKSMGFTEPEEYAFNQDQQFIFEAILFSGLTLYNNGGSSKVKLAEAHKRFVQDIQQKNEDKLSRTQELNTAKIQALRELGYTEINEENAKEVLEKIAEIQSRKV